MTRLLPVLLLAACSLGGTSSPPTPPSLPTGQVVALPEGGALHRLDASALATHMSTPAERLRIYNVWATWCVPCRAEMPELKAFGEAHPNVDLWFVSTDHPKVAGDKVPRFLQEQGLTGFHHIAAAEGESDLMAQVPGWPDVLPVTYVVGPDGQRRATFVGRVDVADLETAVAQAR